MTTEDIKALKYKTVLTKIVNVICWLILFFIMSKSLYYTVNYSVDILYYDQWDNLPTSDVSKWFSFMCEHRPAILQFYQYVCYLLNGFDQKFYLISSWFVYMGAVVIFYKILNHYIKNCPFLPLFLIPFFTALLMKNFLWGIYSFTLFFAFLAVWFGFIKEQNYKNSFIFCFVLICSNYCMNVVFPFGIFLIYFLKEILEYFNTKNKKTLQTLGIVTLLYICSVICFTIGFEKPANHPAWIYPNNSVFWIYLMNLFSELIFSSNLFLLQVPIIILLWLGIIFDFIKSIIKKDCMWGLYAIATGVILSMLVITLSRAGFGIGLVNRHVALYVSIVPFIFAILYKNIVSSSKKNVKIILSVFFVIIFICLFPQIKDKTYKNISISHASAAMIGKICVDNFYKGKNDGYCPTIHPEKAAKQFLEAKKLNLHFTRNLSY